MRERGFSFTTGTMEFRPCIDIHNGKVKQIVGGSLKDAGNWAKENFVSEQDAAFYAKMYQKDGVQGGHIILLNAKDSEYYEATKAQAMLALKAYPNGLQVGGGVADALQVLEPQLGVLLLVVGGLLEDSGDLLIALLLGDGCEIGVLVARLALAGKGVPQVALGLSALQFHNDNLLREICFRTPLLYPIFSKRQEKFFAVLE